MPTFRLAILAFVTCLAAATCPGQSVVINEVMASNTNTIQDEDGAYSDWIELHNPGLVAVDLTDWGLSDSYSSPFKWRFGAVTIQPGEFLLVWASSKNRPAITNANMLHTSFAISKGGEEVVLTDPATNLVDALEPTAMADDQSVGRQPDATGGWHYFSQATPGAANTTTGTPAALAPPEFSQPGGVYTAAVSLAFSTTITGGVIRYTLDGSEPTASSPVFSTNLTIASRAGETNNVSMIPTNAGMDPGPPYYEGWQAPQGEVFKLTTVRARVFKTGALPSRTVTRSYLVDTNGTHRYTLPILSLASDSSNFFSNATGIYVPGWFDNYNQEGDAWERPGSVEMIDTNGLVAFQFDAGFRIHGGSTRNRPRKTLRVYARNPSSLDYPLFPEKPVTKYDTFILRNGGNDWGQAIFRDAYLQSLVAHTRLDRQSSRAAVVFIDGEYWGIHHIRDRFDDGYIENHYGLGEQEFCQLETGWEAPNYSQPIYDRGNTNLVADYYGLLSFVNTQGVASTANYAAVQGRMDIDNFCDYFITQIWSGNTDWPGNNMRLWRSAATNLAPEAPYAHDGKWRWMLYDTDFGLGLDFFYVPGYSQFASFNSLQHAAAVNGSEFSNNTNATLLFRRLLDNTEFRRTFVTRASDHLNSSFRTDRVLGELSNTVARLAPEMAEHVRRWRQPLNWSNDVARVASYAALRTPAVWGHVQSYFGLGARTTLTVNVSDPAAGWVRVNSLDLRPGTPGVGSPAYPWNGAYFPNYPVSMTATALPGYRFTAWRRVYSATNTPLLSTNALLAIAITNATEVRADFEVDTSGLVPQPHDLSQGSFTFTAWSDAEPAGTYPSNMVFEQTATLDPVLATELDSLWTLEYNIASRSRVNGLGSDGVAFINTGSAQTNIGAGYLGSAIAALRTVGRTNIQVAWTGGTVTPNIRVQGLRLQYRVGASGPFSDVLDNASQPVEYIRNETAGHATAFDPVQLPADAENEPYVQLRWKYHWISGTSGARAQLRLDDVLVTSQGQVFSPVAQAAVAGNVELAGGSVELQGSASTDPDGVITNFAWSQTQGPALILSNSASANLMLPVPAQPTTTVYSFQLVVTDNDGLTATGAVEFTQQDLPLVSTYPRMYFRGTPNQWSTNLMTLVSNFVWEIRVDFGSLANERFKFDASGTWSVNFGDYEPDGIGDLEGSNIAAPYGAGLYLIRFNDQTRAYTVAKPAGPFSSSHQTMSLAGAFNQWALADNLDLVDDHLWRGVFAIFSNQTFKFVADGNWSNAWGDLQPPAFINPATMGTADVGAPMITVTSVFNGVYTVSFNELSRAYRFEKLAYRAGATNHMTDWEQAHGIDLLRSTNRNSDTDGDGLSNLGEAQHGTFPSVKDSDGDGQSDAEEVVAATDPLDDSSRFELLAGALSTVNWPGATGRTYRVESSAQLPAQEWLSLDGYENEAGSNSIMQALISSTQDQHQVRVRIIQVQYLPGTP